MVNLPTGFGARQLCDDAIQVFIVQVGIFPVLRSYVCFQVFTKLHCVASCVVADATARDVLQFYDTNITRAAKKPEACGEWRRERCEPSSPQGRSIFSQSKLFITFLHDFCGNIREQSVRGRRRWKEKQELPLEWYWVGIFTRNTQGTINITTIAAGSKNKKKGNEQPMIQSVA